MYWIAASFSLLFCEHAFYFSLDWERRRGKGRREGQEGYIMMNMCVKDKICQTCDRMRNDDKLTFDVVAHRQITSSSLG